MVRSMVWNNFTRNGLCPVSVQLYIFRVHDDGCSWVFLLHETWRACDRIHTHLTFKLSLLLQSRHHRRPVRKSAIYIAKCIPAGYLSKNRKSRGPSAFKRGLRQVRPAVRCSLGEDMIRRGRKTTSLCTIYCVITAL